MVVPYFDQTAPVGLSLPLEDGRMEKLPMKSGRPAALYFPGVPPFRKGVRRQDFSCLFQVLRNGETIGKYNAPGAPNITGCLAVNRLSTGGIFQQSGAVGMDQSDTYGSPPDVGTEGNNYSITINASLSNSEYGAQPTVMPASADILVAVYLGRSA